MEALTEVRVHKTGTSEESTTLTWMPHWR